MALTRHLKAPLRAMGVRRPDHKWLVAASVSLGAIMATIDVSIVNVALPQIRGSVGASIDQMTSLATSFAIAQVIVMPLTAFLARFLGQKRVYLFCLGLFLFGSVMCAMAHTLAQLVAARALQGLGAGALQPTQMAILRQTFPPREQGMAMAVVGMAIMIGPAVGPTLGGWIVDNWSWPWIFYINIPVGVLGILMTSNFVHEPEDIRQANRAQAALMRKSFDWQGILFLSVGLAGMQYVLEEGNRNDWFDSRTITVASIVAVVSIIAFVFQELSARAPAVNLRLFRDPVFASATVIGGVMFSNLMAGMFFLPVFMQEILGFTALKSGLVLLPRALIMMVTTPIVGHLYNRVQPRILVALGVVCVATGSWEMGRFTLDTSTAGIVPILLLQGVGFSCLFVPLATVALSYIPRVKLADATGLNSVVRQFGGSAGLAIYGTLLTKITDRAHAALVVHVDASRLEVAQRISGMVAGLMSRGMNAVSAQTAALQALEGTVMRQAAVMGFERVFILTGLVMTTLLPLIFVLRDKEHHQPSDAAARPAAAPVE
ncbi:MAG TPA: DHA2 family efflux MFS transporter permease subunit [Candidatus Saccharimonadales bacterium]|nr:DHA2 family efflux MFS transporter permease subunit [Candidatus Saccharimonadales bacterium]